MVAPAYRHSLRLLLLGAVSLTPWLTKPAAAQATLGDAVDDATAAWSSPTDPPWFAQTAVSRNGDAAQSGPAADGQTSTLAAQVDGPAVLWFAGRTSTEAQHDFLRFAVDGLTLAEWSGENNWFFRNVPLAAGSHTLEWHYAKDAAGSAGSDAAWLDDVRFTPLLGLEAALDVDPAAVTVTTDGAAAWFGQTMITTSSGGGDAAQSGPIAHGQRSGMETTLTGPGTVDFAWRTSTENQRDVLSFLLDGVARCTISGETGNGWGCSVALPSGVHTARWEYAKDASGTSGMDAVWVDNVRITAAIPLAEALDNADLAFAVAGDEGWFGVPGGGVDGGDCGRSGAIGNGQESRLETTVDGPVAVSFRARLPANGTQSYTFLVDGGVANTVAYNSASFTFSQFVHLLPAGPHTLTWVYTKGADVPHTNHALLDAVAVSPLLPLDGALDTPGREWRVSGDGAWAGQPFLSTFGGSAAQTPRLADGQAASLETTVTGPAILSFFWAISAEAGADVLRLFLDDLEKSAVTTGSYFQEGRLFVPSGEHVVRWEYRKDAAGGAGNDAAWLDRVVVAPTIPLGDAVDAPALAWSSAGDAEWFGQTALSQQGGDAAQSGSIGHGQSTTLSTQVAGPKVLAFSWKGATEYGGDFLGFSVDGLEHTASSGSFGWDRYVHVIPPGTHTLAWTYRKNASGSAWGDAGYVDNVVVVDPGPSLAEALDNAALPFTTGGDGAWLGQTLETWWLGDAAQSPVLLDGQSAWIEAPVEGPGYLYFRWSGSHAAGDALAYSLDGVERDQSWSASWTTAAQLIPPGAHTVRWTYRKDASGSAGNDCGRLDGVILEAGIPLGEALDNTALPWSTGGDAPWFAQSFERRRGSYAAMAVLGHGQSTWLETSLSGPALLAYYFDTSTEAGHDLLRVFVDGVERDAASGAVTWDQGFVALGEGTHTVRWVFSRDGSGDFGANRVLLDDVRVLPFIPLAEALDAPGQTWTTGADAPWAGQPFTYPWPPQGHAQDADAAQAARVADGGTSWLETQVTGPCRAYFTFAVSAEAGRDGLRFLVDGVLRDQWLGSYGFSTPGYTLGEGVHTLRWEYAKDASGSGNEDSAWVDGFYVEQLIPLGEAVDNTALAWRTGGDAPWYGQSALSHEGGDAAASGDVGDAQESWLETDLAGPGFLSFRWKVSAAATDVLELLVDGAVAAAYARTPLGEQWFTYEAFAIPDGAHTVRWRFRKDASGSELLDTAWLDAVRWTPAVPLADALDAPGLAWQVSGAASWTGQAETSHDGVDAAQSFGVTGPGATLLSTSVDGPAFLAFWWRRQNDNNGGSGPPLRLLVDGVETAASVSPDAWERVTVEVGPGTHALGWEFTPGVYLNVKHYRGWVDEVAVGHEVSLAEALDNDTVVWSTGALAWRGQTAVSHFGGDSAQSPALAAGQSAVLETVVHGPAAVGFAWSNAGVSYTDPLHFEIDGQAVATMAERTDWEERAVALEAGEHTIRWRQMRLTSSSRPVVGWVDRVRVEPVPSVLFPNGGEMLLAGEQVEIAWQGVADPTSSVRIELLRGAALERVLAEAAQNSGTWTWRVPANLEPGADYFVRVVLLLTESVRDRSDAPFVVAAPFRGAAREVVLPDVEWTAAPAPASATEVQVTDVTGGSTVTVTFAYGGGRTRGPFALWTNTGGAGRTATFANVLQKLDALDPAKFAYLGRAGALVFATQDPAHRVRVWSRTKRGARSRTAPGLPTAALANGARGPALVFQDLENSRARGSLVRCVNLSGAAVDVDFSLLDARGARIGSAFSRAFAAMDWQSLDPFAAAGRAAPAATPASATLQFSPRAPAPLFCSGHVFSRLSADSAPLALGQASGPWESGPASEVVVPGVSWSGAACGTLATELQVTDRTGGAAVHATFFYGGGRTRGPFLLWKNAGGAGASARFPNVLQALDALDPGAFAWFKRSGALVLDTGDPLARVLVSSRASCGSAAGAAPGLRADASGSFAEPGRAIVIPGLASDASFAARVSCVNSTDAPAEVRFQVEASTGALVGAPFTVGFVPRDARSFDPFAKAGSPYPGASHRGARVVAASVSGDGRVACTGTTTSRSTGDPSLHPPSQ